MVLLIFFFILLCIAFPLGEATRVTFALTTSVTLLEVVVILGVSIWLLVQIKNKKKPSSSQAIVFLLTIAVFALSLLANVFTLNKQQLFVSGLYIVRFFYLGMLFFMVRNAKIEIKKKIEYFLFAGGILLLTGGYVQYFLYPSLRNLIYFGWDEHFYRMFGTFFDPNFLGLFLVLFFMYLLTKLFILRPQQQKIQFSLLFLLAAFTFLAIMLTYSRTALLALFSGLIVIFWDKKLWKWLWFFTIIALIATTLLFFLSTRSKDVNSFFRSTSAGARIGSAKNALKIFADHALLGVGFNSYRYAQYRYHFMTGSPIQEDHGASGADSSILLVLATSGIVGFFTFCMLLFVHMRALMQQKNKLGLSTATAFFVGSFFVNGLFYPFLLVWVWIVLGFTESDER